MNGRYLDDLSLEPHPTGVGIQLQPVLRRDRHPWGSQQCYNPAMKHLALLTLISSFALSSVAYADAGVDCPKSYRPKKKTPKKKPPAAKPQEQSCTVLCMEGGRGPRGDQGPPGLPGRDGRDGKDGSDAAVRSIAVAGGLMTSLHAPHGDWAWGPALQVRFEKQSGTQLSLSLGLAGLAPGDSHEEGTIGHLAVTRMRGSDLKSGLGVGLYVTSISGSPSNGSLDGRYVGVDLHWALQKPVTDSLNLRFEVGPVVSYLRDDAEGRQLGIGLQSTLFVGGEL